MGFPALSALRRMSAASDTREALVGTLQIASQVEFYRSAYAKQGLPFDVRQFERLPVIEPVDLADHPELFHSEVVSAFRVSCSGGTLGQPKILYRTCADWKHSVRNVAELFRMVGVKQCLLIAHPFGLWAVGHLALDACQRLNCLAVPVGNHEDPEFIAFLLKRFPVDAVFTTPSLWKRFATATERQWLPRTARLVLAGEQLHDDDRRFFCAQWRGGVHNVYGSEETDGLAAECELHSGMHILEHSFLFEILVDGQVFDTWSAGTHEGELVITSLYHQGTPLVRYRLGDLVRIHRDVTPCACGNRNPRLHILGKREESVELFDATRLSYYQAENALQKALGRPLRFQLMVENADQPPFIESVTVLSQEALSADDRQRAMEAVANCSVELADSIRGKQVDLRIAEAGEAAGWTNKGKRRRILDCRKLKRAQERYETSHS
jgi:phenylacetate-CoA ligase